MVGVWIATVNATLSSKASVGFDELLCGNTCASLKRVDILSKAHAQETLFVQETNKRVGQCGFEFSWG